MCVVLYYCRNAGVHLTSGMWILYTLRLVKLNCLKWLSCLRIYRALQTRFNWYLASSRTSTSSVQCITRGRQGQGEEGGREAAATVRLTRACWRRNAPNDARSARRCLLQRQPAAPAINRNGCTVVRSCPLTFGTFLWVQYQDNVVHGRQLALHSKSVSWVVSLTCMLNHGLQCT